MANVPIEILEDGVPRPNPALVAHGDTVTFTVDGTQEVEVTFNTPYCLNDDSPVELVGGTLTASCAPRAVKSTAQKKTYTYNVAVLRAGSKSVGKQKETKQGNLEVTTDPPKDEDKKR